MSGWRPARHDAGTGEKRELLRFPQTLMTVIARVACQSGRHCFRMHDTKPS